MHINDLSEGFQSPDLQSKPPNSSEFLQNNRPSGTDQQIFARANSSSHLPLLELSANSEGTPKETSDHVTPDESSDAFYSHFEIIEGSGNGRNSPKDGRVKSDEIKDLFDKHFENIDGSGAGELSKMFGLDKDDRIDSAEISDYMKKNMHQLTDRELRVLLTASLHDKGLATFKNDEWGAENGGVSRSDIDVWKKAQLTFEQLDALLDQ